MVKNQFGGNKHKSQGRKFLNAKPSNKLRLAECEGEVYAVVTKMNGNGMFNAHAIDNVSRLGFIRGKFSGRGRRDNRVEVGKWVLLGDRSWATGTDSKGALKADLLEVYSDLEKKRLQDSVENQWHVLLSNDLSLSKEQEDETIRFADEEEEEIEGKVDTIAFDTGKDISTEFNIDDI